MISKPSDRRAESLPDKYYWGANVPMSEIRRFAKQVAERYEPDKIILFGSYAYGQPNANSDVDVLVVMPARNELDQGFKIHSTILPPFPLDIIVRTPKNLEWRLKEGDSFLREIVSKGKVLHEKPDTRMGTEGRSRSNHRARKSSKRKKAS